jgi:stage III sporulation protein AD
MLQLVGIALVGGIITVYLKTINPELAMMSLICTGIIIVVTAFTYLSETFDLFRKIAEISNVDQTLLKIIIKIVGIGYVIEFAAGILEDFGVKSIADKLVFAGKIIILTVSVPIFYALINILVGLVT